MRGASPQPVNELPDLEEALKLMQQALAAVDSSGAPSDVGAYLDQAIQRLLLAMGRAPPTA